MTRASITVAALWCGLAAAGALAACGADTTTTTPDTGTALDAAVTDSVPNPDGAPDGPATDGPAVDANVSPDSTTSPDGPLGNDKGAPGPDAIPPAELGPGACTSNADCNGKNQFCDLPLGCVPPGSCKNRPVMCPGVYDPVCGCDGKNYGNPCAANAAGVSVAYKGVCSTKTCATIRTDYASAVVAAKVCSPMLPVVQCTSVVTKDLACGCKTAVNSANAAAYALLLGLQATWTSMGCDQQPWSCPKIPCPSVSTGACNGATSLCVDVP